MAMPVPPDPEAMLIEFLLSRSAVTTLTTTDRIGTDLAAGDNVSIRATTVGGDVSQLYESTTMVELECWGGTRAQAGDLARVVVSVMPDVVGPHTLGYVSGWDVTLGPFFREDPVSHRPRYIVDVQLITHANP